MKLHNKTIVITGTSSGIGKSLAEAFLSEGSRVTGIDVSGATISNPKYTHMICDVTNKEKINLICKKLPKKIDIFIQNAGTYTPKNIFDSSEEEICEQMEVHVFSFFRFIQNIKRRVKNLIIISSYHGLEIIAKPGAYSLAKNALNALAEMTKQTYDIPTLLVCPGPVETPLANKHKTPAEIRKVKKNRILPQELAQQILKAYSLNKTQLLYKSKTKKYYMK
jgi:NAD(P)-dependent dehydrogenase (short-subunit alcohol dehydrogenase family)